MNVLYYIVSVVCLFGSLSALFLASGFLEESMSVKAKVFWIAFALTAATVNYTVSLYTLQLAINYG